MRILENVMAFGTDNERALIDEFKHNFDRSVNLLCDDHLKTTSKENSKILELSGRLSESGLTDANDTEKFRNMLPNLKEKWS